MRALAAILLVMTAVVTVSSTPAAAAPPHAAMLRSPFDAGTLVGTPSPATLPHRAGTGFGMRLVKAPGATVYANFVSPRIVTLRTGTFQPSPGGGTSVPVTVLTDDAPTGTVWFHHLRNLRVTANAEYPSGIALGTLGTASTPSVACADGTADGWPYSAMWTVCTPTAVYTQVDVAQGCTLAAPGSTATAFTPLLMLGSTYATDHTGTCDPADTIGVNSDVRDGDDDGVFDVLDACENLAGFPAWRGCLPQLLRNASFGQPLALTDPRDWNVAHPAGGTTHVQRRTATAGLDTIDGATDLAMSVSAPGGSLRQALPIRTVPGQSFTFSIWARAATSGTTASGWIALRDTGGPADRTVRDRFSVGTSWTLLMVTHDVRSIHTGLRAEVVLDTPGVSIRLDGAQLTRSLLRNGSLEDGTSAGWTPAQATTKLATYTNATNAKDGSRYAAMNVATAGGAVVQEVGEFTRPGQSHTFSVWVRTTDSRPVAGTLRLSAAGTSPILGVNQPFVAGPRWTRVSVTYDATQSRSFMRAQLTLTTTGRTLLFDGGQLLRNALRNGSLEEGSTGGWRTANGTGGSTALVARRDPGVAEQGSWYAALASTSERGSMYQDIPLAARAGQSYSLSVWVRKPGTGVASGALVLRGKGGAVDVSASDSFRVGQRWTLVTVTLDLGSAATFLRAELIVDTPGITVHVDEALLSPGTNRV